MIKHILENLLASWEACSARKISIQALHILIIRFPGPVLQIYDISGVESKLSNSTAFLVFKEQCEPCNLTQATSVLVIDATKDPHFFLISHSVWLLPEETYFLKDVWKKWVSSGRKGFQWPSIHLHYIIVLCGTF